MIVMKFQVVFTAFTLALAGVTNCGADNIFIQDEVDDKKEMVTCTLYRVEGIPLSPDLPGFSRIRCQTESHGRAKVINLPNNLSDNGPIKSGQIQITVPLLSLSSGIIDMAADDVDIVPSETLRYARPDMRDYYRMLVVRVTDKKGDAPTKSAAQLSDDILGTKGDVWNLATGYKRCSGGKLNIVPGLGEGVVDGVLELKINDVVAGEDSEDVEEWVSDKFDQIEDKLGLRYTHRMYVLPKSVEFNDVAAYATIAGYTSVFHDEMSSYPSITIHEIAHNFDHDHSTKGYSEYGDRTCMMGLNRPWADDGPRACFNGAKSWEFAWYSDRHLRIDPRVENFRGKLISIDDYLNKKAKSDDEKTVIRIDGLNDADLFLIYNRAKGVNAGVNEFRNMVTIVEARAYNDYSYWRGALSDGEEYRSQNWNKSGKKLIVKVCKTVKGNLDYASVIIYLNKKNNVSCPLKCGSDKEFGLSIQNDAVTKLRYIVQRQNTGGQWGKKKLMWRSLSKNELFVDNICLDPTRCYRFKIFDREQKKRGLKSGGYTLRWMGDKIKESTFPKGPREVTTFGDCST